MAVSVGVDLHKGQFTVYWRSHDGLLERSDRFLTNEQGMTCFEAVLLKLIGSGESVKVGVGRPGTRGISNAVLRMSGCQWW